MLLYYDEKIENLELGYTLYLDFLGGTEFWEDHRRGKLYLSCEAGDVLCEEVEHILEKRQLCVLNQNEVAT